MDNLIISSHRIRVAVGTLLLIIGFMPIVMLIYTNEKRNILTINSHHAQTSAAFVNNLLNGYNHLLTNTTIGYLTANKDQQELLATMIKRRQNAENALLNLSIFDLNATLKYTTNPNISINIKPYQQEIIKKGLFISKPVFENNRWTLQFCKHIKDSNQKPLGISVATIDLNTISSQFSQLPIDDYTTISLVSQDGIYLASSPFNNYIIGTNLLEMDQIKIDLSSSNATIFRSSKIGGKRCIATTPLFAFDLAIVSTLSTNMLFQKLKEELVLLAIMFFAIELLLITISTKFKDSQLEKESISKQKQLEIEQSEERFRMIASLTRELIIEFYKDRRSIYFSGACKSITGFLCSNLNRLNMEELISLVHKDDKKNVLKFFLIRKESSCVTYRIAHRDGGFIDVEMYGGYQNDNKLIGFIRYIGDCKKP